MDLKGEDQVLVEESLDQEEQALQVQDLVLKEEVQIQGIQEDLQVNQEILESLALREKGQDLDLKQEVQVQLVQEIRVLGVQVLKILENLGPDLVVKEVEDKA